MARVAVVGVGATIHSPVRNDVDVAEMVLEAISAALSDAGLALADIENAVTASMDFWDGRTIASMAIAEVVGSYRKSEARTCSDGLQAVMYQWARIATGSFRIGLVTAHCKESAGNIHDIEVAATDVFSQRRLEFDANVIAGLTADLLDQQGRYDREAAARVVVEARRRGRANPMVEDLPQLSVDEVLNAPTIADPLRQFDRAPDRDGAVAFVIVSEDVAAGLAAEPVWITGVATTTGPYWSDGDLTSTAYIEDARRRAGSMAEWDEAPADLVELSAQFSFQHLEFAPVFDKDPFDPALNPSGGWMAGNPFVVTGSARMAEAVHQLRGDAGDRQVENVRRAYAHGIHGLGAQTHTVIALEGSR